jgi:hypothetical protein
MNEGEINQFSDTKKYKTFIVNIFKNKAKIFM